MKVEDIRFASEVVAMLTSKGYDIKEIEIDNAKVKVTYIGLGNNEVIVTIPLSISKLDLLANLRAF